MRQTRFLPLFPACIAALLCALPLAPASAEDTEAVTDDRPWHTWTTDNTSNMFVAGIILDRVDWLSQNAASEASVGDLSVYDGGDIRDFRFGITGTLDYFERPWTYTFFVATNAFDRDYDVSEQTDLTLYDLRLDIPVSENSHVAIGKQKEPVSGDRMQPAIFNHMQERAAVSDALLRSRNVGISWYGYEPGAYLSWSVGVFNDWLDDGSSISDADTSYAGRLAWAPFRANNDEQLLHVGLSQRWTDIGGRGIRYRATPELDIAPHFVDTSFGQPEPRFPASSSSTWVAELSWRDGPFWLGSEVARTDVRSSDFGNPSFDGYWLAASWIVSGEVRPYNKRRGLFGGVPVAGRLDRGGKGALELSARWSNVDLNDGRIQGGDMDIASIGLAWWWTPQIGLDVDLQYIWNTRYGVEETARAVNTRVLLLLE